MDFKKIWRNMVETGLPVGILTFFKQALVWNPRRSIFLKALDTFPAPW